MNPFDLRPLGRTGIKLTALGLGGTSIGSLYSTLSEEDAVSTVSEAYNAGVRYFDTAPFYGAGSSERRMGKGLANRARTSFVLSSKCGRVLHEDPTGAGRTYHFPHEEPMRAEFDFSHDGILRSVEDSLERLGLDAIDVLYVHDPQGHWQQVLDESYPAMDRLRREGTVKAIGAGLNFSEVCYLLLRSADFDCFLLAGRYNLLEQHPLAEFFPLCERRGVGIVIGGPLASGILATGAVPGAHYQYRPATKDVIAEVNAIERVCRGHGVPLLSAALQFPLHNPLVASVIVGARTAAETAANVAAIQREIPASLWSDLKSEGLLHRDAPVPKA
jgi:D-threo-aldose 1-dehydrogenase